MKHDLVELVVQLLCD